jgi:hypothetical protein
MSPARRLRQASQKKRRTSLEEGVNMVVPAN